MGKSRPKTVHIKESCGVWLSTKNRAKLSNKAVSKTSSGGGSVPVKLPQPKNQTKLWQFLTAKENKPFGYDPPKGVEEKWGNSSNQSSGDEISTWPSHGEQPLLLDFSLSPLKTGNILLSQKSKTACQERTLNCQDLYNNSPVYLKVNSSKIRPPLSEIQSPVSNEGKHLKTSIGYNYKVNSDTQTNDSKLLTETMFMTPEEEEMNYQSSIQWHEPSENFTLSTQIQLRTDDKCRLKEQSNPSLSMNHNSQKTSSESRSTNSRNQTHKDLLFETEPKATSQKIDKVNVAESIQNVETSQLSLQSVEQNSFEPLEEDSQFTLSFTIS